MPYVQRFAKPYRVRNGRTFRLKDVDPDDTGPIKSRSRPSAGSREESRVSPDCKRSCTRRTVGVCC